MINVSNAFREKFEAGEPVRMVVDITFPDGTKKTINEDIMNGDNGFSDCADSSSFPVGATICKTLTLSINNDQEQWKNYNFYGAKIHAYLKLQTSYAAPESVSTLLDESYNPILDSTGDPIIATQAATKDIIETIDKGVYTVTTPEQYSDIITITALDDMYKANKAYTSGLKLPQSLINLVRDACETIGIGMNLTMSHGDIIIRSIPDNMTFRQLFGYAAMVESANARIDYSGNLGFIKWDFEKADIPDLKNYGNPPVLSSDDIIITGIRVKNGQSNDDTDSEYSGMYGKEGYLLELENELIDSDQLETVASIIGEQIVGARFRNLEGDLVYNPLIEFGDMVYTYDRLGNKYLTPLTDVSGNVGGLTTVKTQADDPIRGSSDYYSEGTKAIVAARQMVKKETSAREEAVKRLEQKISDTNASGMFCTDVRQEDGSTIRYLHDKPTLKESSNVIKVTSEAIGISNDGGKTYPYGITLDGETITRLLYAEGINADYINAGTILVKDKDKNVIFEADMDAGSVYISGNVQIGGGKTLDETLKEFSASAKNMTIQLSNEYQGIPVDSDGNYSSFPECSTQVTVMYGAQDITDNCTYTITKSQNIQGNWNKERKTYTVTGLTADSGWVNIKAAYLNNLVVSKQFSLAKQYAGPQGIPGVGVDGKTTYLHIRYAPVQNPTAAQMSKTPNKYIGTYTDFSGVDSTDPTKYTWAKFEGDQGAQGPKGADGKSSYTWMKYATRPDGLDMSDNPDYVPLLDSTGSPILDSAGEQIYTVTQATYIGVATNKDTATESTNPADYTWSRFRGVDGYDGKDGANGIPGKDGKDGKTQYTHLAYANSADGRTDFSVSDGNREYIGMYVDFVEADSTDPTKYTWSLIKGANGAQGVPGTPGANGKTPYFHIAYANSADGRTGFSVDDSVNKLYIGQYTDYTPDDSTDPTKYSWTKIKGEQGAAGRTYFFQSNADVLLMGADKKITPAPLIVDSFYRDGNGEVAQSQKGWWKLEKSTDNGATWSALTVSQTAALDRLSINVNSLSLKAHDMIKVSLYFDQAKTKLADQQTYAVAIDVAALTQEDIVNILSDDGKWKGLWYNSDDNTLYISFNAARGGTLSLGGKNDGNGKIFLYDEDGTYCGQLNNAGLTFPLNKKYGVNISNRGITKFNYTPPSNIDKDGIETLDMEQSIVEIDADGIVSTSTDDLSVEKQAVIYKLIVNSSAILNGTLHVQKEATFDEALYFYDWEQQKLKTGRRQPVASITADGSRAAYISTGRTVTGTSELGETYKPFLNVRGQFGFTDGSYTSNKFYSGSLTSDARLKENVKLCKISALEIINRMRACEFDWKKGGHEHIGFIADDLEKIDDKLTLGGGYDENGEMDIKQINSPYLLNYAIKAIQELSAKVDEQEKRIKELERRLQ